MEENEQHENTNEEVKKPEAIIVQSVPKKVVAARRPAVRKPIVKPATNNKNIPIVANIASQKPIVRKPIIKSEIKTETVSVEDTPKIEVLKTETEKVTEILNKNNLKKLKKMSDKDKAKEKKAKEKQKEKEKKAKEKTYTQSSSESINNGNNPADGQLSEDLNKLVFTDLNKAVGSASARLMRMRSRLPSNAVRGELLGDSERKVVDHQTNELETTKSHVGSSSGIRFAVMVAHNRRII